MRKSKIIENQKEMIETLTKKNYDLELKIEKLKEEASKAEEDILNKYKYAILVDKSHRVKVWNEGRFEPSVRNVSFNVYIGNIPELTLKK